MLNFENFFSQNLLLLITFEKLVNSPFFLLKVRLFAAIADWNLALYFMAPWLAFWLKSEIPYT